MIIGYLRVSTCEQLPDRQIDGLRPICDELHIETLSAAAKVRPIFDKVLRCLKPGDTLAVYDLDRAFRSTIDALSHADKLRQRGIHFQIVSLGVDTATPDGKLIFTVIAALAEHERARLAERTRQGLAAARRRGKRLGRPPKLNASDIERARRALSEGRNSLRDLAHKCGVHPSTLRRSLARNSPPAD